LEDIRKLVRQYFPFETFNPGQEEAIIQCVQQVLSGTRHIVLGSPVATGKSAIATTVHRVLNHMRRSWRTTIVTTSKGLQQQYVKDDPDICDLKGRSNYNCLHGAQYYNHPECRKKQAMGRCKKQQDCEYYKKRKEWSENAKLRLTNTSFHVVAGETVLASDATRANLVIIDECHELPSVLIEHATFDLKPKNLFYVEKLFGDWMMGVIADFINVFSVQKEGTAFRPTESMMESVEILEKELTTACELIDKMTEDKTEKMEILTGASEEIESLRESLGNFTAPNGEWILMEYSMSEHVSIKPVYASQVAQSSMFYKCNQFIHMSATICGYEEYCNSLGIDPKTSVFIDVDNPIPIKNRPVVVLNALKVSGDYDRKKHAAIVDAIIDKHGKDNGVIHTVSFKLAEELKANSKHSHRMVISNDRREILGLLNQHNTGKIILSPSVTTGYDFKGEMAKWQIIAKIPYLSMGDVWVKLNMDRSSRWYSRQAILPLVQASGRVCRGMTDYGVTYIIDSNFMFLFRQNHDLFPEWWVNAMVIPKKK
jgi:Rad3-related DNA helicase